MSDTEKTDPGIPIPPKGTFGAGNGNAKNPTDAHMMTSEEADADARWAQLADEDPSPAAGSLFDFKFKTFITPSMIRLIYVVMVVLFSLGALFQLYMIADDNLMGGAERFGAFCLVPILWLLAILVLRVTCEFILVIFCIEKNTRS